MDTTYWDAKIRGFEAFENGKTITENPFDPATQSRLFDSWAEGWLDASSEKQNETDNVDTL